MRIRAWMALAVVCSTIGLLAGTGFTEDPAPSMDEHMDEMFEKEKPGEAHAFLASFAGTWDVDVKMWMQPGKPIESKAVSTNEMTLDGRFLQCAWEGTFMGKAFRGRSTMGFNNFKKRFESSWVSNMDTGIYHQASADAGDGKSFVLQGEYDSWGGKMPTRMVWTKVDEDTWTMASYASPKGHEIQEMAMTYKRRKEAPAKAAPGRGCCPPTTKGPGY